MRLEELVFGCAVIATGVAAIIWAPLPVRRRDRIGGVVVGLGLGFVVGGAMFLAAR
jgi:hypothetical protein